MDGIQQAQRAIETATSHGATWLVDHWLVIGLCIFGVYVFLALISEIGKHPR